ncbi:hypothetical protein D1871_07935 [Nakamurella silvestris]|nr:hypothetical protein D1871_07935 [Nakamurella silvestris]
MGHSDPVLIAALRARPRTVEELARLVRLDLTATEGEVARLVRSGDITVDNGQLGYPPIIERTARELGILAEKLREDAHRLARELEETAESLPLRARDWAIGERLDRAGISIETFHGERAAEDLWLELSTQASSEAEACVVFADMSPFEVRDSGRAPRFVEAIGNRKRVRAIMPPDVREDRFDSVLTTYGGAGIHIRTMEQPPGWFWLDGDRLALPFVWGEAWPSSVRLIQDRTLAGLARGYFEQLWGSAQNITPASGSWEPLLTLMRQGRTLETASRQLGINPRTGRRRAAAAMEHYGVETLFALGAAWGEGTFRSSAGDPDAAGKSSGHG